MSILRSTWFFLACDWQMIADCANLIIVTRNALAKTIGRRDHIVKA